MARNKVQSDSNSNSSNTNTNDTGKPRAAFDIAALRRRRVDTAPTTAAPTHVTDTSPADDDERHPVYSGDKGDSIASYRPTPPPDGHVWYRDGSGETRAVKARPDGKPDGRALRRGGADALAASREARAALVAGVAGGLSLDGLDVDGLDVGAGTSSAAEPRQDVVDALASAWLSLWREWVATPSVARAPLTLSMTDIAQGMPDVDPAPTTRECGAAVSALRVVLERARAGLGRTVSTGAKGRGFAALTFRG